MRVFLYTNTNSLVAHVVHSEHCERLPTHEHVLVQSHLQPFVFCSGLVNPCLAVSRPRATFSGSSLDVEAEEQLVQSDMHRRRVAPLVAVAAVLQRPALNVTTKQSHDWLRSSLQTSIASRDQPRTRH